MRLLSLILSFYVLLLAVTPCGDNEDCEIDAAKIAATANHADHEHESENCSPFCICSCCGNYSQITLNFQFAFTSTVNTELVLPTYTAPVSEFRHSIWQPPQIG